MKSFLLYVSGFAMWFIIFAMGLKTCDHELKQNEIKNLQWVEDSNNGKPFTNYGE